MSIALVAWIGACTQPEHAPPPPPGHGTPAIPTRTPTPTREGLDDNDERTIDPYLWRVPGEVVGTHRGRVYIANAGHVSSFDLSCRRDCKPVWRATVDGWPSQVAFHGDRVFVPADEHGILIFPTECRPCRSQGRIRFGVFDRTSTFDNARERPPSIFRLQVAGHTLYVIGELDLADTSGVQPGRLFAFDAECSAPCRPLWWGPVGDGLLHPTTIREGSVYLPSSNGLSVFPVACRSDGGICSPSWTAPMNTDADLMLMSQPHFAGDLVVELTAGYSGGGDADLAQIAAFPVGCRTDGGICDPLWWREIPRERFAWGPTLHDGQAYITTAGWNPKHMMLGFPLHCSGVCSPSTSFRAPGSYFRGPLSVEGYLVAASYQPGRIAYFDPACWADPCRAIAMWRSSSRVVVIERLGGGRVLAAAGRDLLLFRSPGEGRWKPRWRWSGEERIEAIEARGRFALVTTHRNVYAVLLPDPD